MHDTLLRLRRWWDAGGDVPAHVVRRATVWEARRWHKTRRDVLGRRIERAAGSGLGVAHGGADAEASASRTLGTIALEDAIRRCRASGTMSKKGADALRLMYLEGLSHKAAARRMGLSRGLFEYHRAKAARTISNLLGRCCPGRKGHLPSPGSREWHP